MFKFNALWFILLTAWFFQLNEMFGQECTIMHTKKQPYVMGLKQMIYVDLDEVDTVTLPVVFHVVHTGSSSDNNISDEQILSQLDVLNEEFEDSKIQFCMAVRDPDGNPTNGITRYDASWNDQYVSEGVSNGQMAGTGWDQETMKESSGCWNPDEYINYYVVSEINDNDGGNGIQGFAYLGPTGDCRDGVVVLYNATGTVGVQKPGRTLGFTGVHEMGHHLSLWHTFSNTSSCGSESNCETQGDQVCDTPSTLSNVYSCDNPVCPDALTENFMDYSPETCKDAFTVGQAERMHEILQGSRQGLVDNLSCVPVVDFDVTAGTAYYQQDWCTPYQDIWVDVVNQGTQTIPFVDVQIFCNGLQGTITLYDLPTGSTQVLFESVYVEGADEFTVQTTSSLDQFSENDASWWPIAVVEGDLLQIKVSTDTWANETSWWLYDSNNEVVAQDSGYPFGVADYFYEACIYDECYTFVIQDTNGDGFCAIDFDGDGNCDIGGDGLVATVGLDTLAATGFGLEFSLWEQTFCNSLPQCNMDYDGDGHIGPQDVLELLVDLGCEGNCYTDPNDDQTVNIHDLLLMLASVGPCPEE
tara:strand:- start:5629 stop:7380 length:1752 start_codon:yes stop_codon:yes gene_type:complete